MVKQRTSQFPGCKSAASLSSTLILVLLIMFSFVVLILLALGILLMPGSSSGYRPKANDLALIVGNTVDRSKGDEGRREQLVEVISWKPRAFAYHSFLWRRKGASALLVSPPDAWVSMEHHKPLSVNILRILFDE
ncbi:probable prolyl 4-hydroxylase 10 [Eucalyptus grandis]|uniref:probable prolyl 4-hydroxylase 10 n=1 Tax=Eucalyptus grandis TaxID=71139 RepID=UPI00192F0CD1|nr:probable prolyl 4-hydroxylase 10 [Eucalyptus grandis]